MLNGSKVRAEASSTLAIAKSPHTLSLALIGVALCCASPVLAQTCPPGPVALTSGSCTVPAGTIITAPGIGLSASGLGTQLTAIGTTVDAGGNAAVVVNGASMTLSDNSLMRSASGEGARVNQATLNATDTKFRTTGNGLAYAVHAEPSGIINLTGGQVGTAGQPVGASRPYALVSQNIGANITTTNTAISTLGAQTAGAVATDGGVATMNGGTVDTQGDEAPGVYSVVQRPNPPGGSRAATVNTINTDVQTVGARAAGGLAERTAGEAAASIFATDSRFITRGDGAAALHAGVGGTIVATRSKLRSQGVGSYGAIAIGPSSSVALNQSDVSTIGAGSHGAVAADGGALTTDTSTIGVSGANSAALLVAGLVAPATATISGGSLTNVSGPTVGVAGAATVNLTNTTVSGSGQWLTVGGAGDFPLAPSPQALGVPGLAEDPIPALPPVATPVATAAPTVANIVASGSTLTGAATTLAGSTSNVALRNATVWNMAASSNVTNLTNDASTVNFGLPAGGIFKTLTVVNYVGVNGTLGMNAVLGADGSASDRLVINGGAATGLTGLRVANAGGAGAITAANGIQVVDTANGGTTSAGAFVLSQRVVAGPYEYLLYRSSKDASNAQAWYLRSEAPPDPPIPAPPTSEVTPPTPIPPTSEVTPPAPPIVPSRRPLYRPEVGAYLSNIRQSASMFVHSLHDRLGEAQLVESQAFESPDSQRRSGWLRLVGRSGESSSADGSFHVDTDSTLLQGGGDIARWSVGSERGRLHVGGMLGYGEARSDATALGNIAQSQGKTDGWGLGAYATWYQNDENKLGWYVDGWGTYGWFKNSVKGDTLPEVKYDSKAFTLSGETGYAMRLGATDWVVEPQAQLVYIKIDTDDVVEVNGTRVSGQNGSGWVGRLGLRTYRTWVADSGRRTQPYLTVNWWRENVDNSVGFNQLALQDLYPKNRYEVKLGINADLGKGWTGWGNVGYQWGNQDFSNTALRLGAKYTW
ncbi:autotransporter outer membrane beta-barrel domain-containing protein [Variovorax sp. J22R115]|uniref:autotransporter family protein n=1 Tax=Variovorax sp. J22R115 TaxID=3053509 RepID=UPI002577D80A|nr:autotransporter outer membrane beta-barrel domain-containing protein [Variovorax sp. J22R115]MDM0053561.1 autotransporter outer membrane beta-barrel domain-containing protein [Variovorax sp. J22R115]